MNQDAASVSLVNVKLTDLGMRLDHASRIAVEFHRGAKWSEFICFDPYGPQKEKLLTAKYLEVYYRSSALPIKEVAQSLIKSLKRAYAPANGIFEIIMEVYIMAVTNVKGLPALTVAELLVVYNDLAKLAGKSQLKSFKEGKLLLIPRIAALQEELGTATAEQQAAAVATAAKAEKRFSGLADLKAETAENKKEKDMATTKKPVAKPAAKKPVAKPADTKPKKQGIGAFCMGLIQAGKDTDAVLAAVQKKFPDAATSASSIAWYRNKLKNEA